MPKLEEVRIPDIGDFDDVEVVEILVAPGDHIAAEQSLITLESEKASMEVPSSVAGTLRELRTSLGARVSAGTLIAVIEVDAAEEVPSAAEPVVTKANDSSAPAIPTHAPNPREPPEDRESEPTIETPAPQPSGVERGDAASRGHASPSVRRMANELGVDLSQVAPTGRKGRVLADDVRRYVKSTMRDGRSATTGALPALPELDREKLGPVEIVPLSRIQRIAARNLHRSWLHIPHVTHSDEADITELESFRRQHTADSEEVKLTFVSFLICAAAAALRHFPRFNSVLLDGEQLALRREIHIGVAVDTEDGLVVPVIRDANTKRIREIAAELADVSQRARAGKLRPIDLQGASFTISSLGGIGGTGFTPIVNWPEVAILGVSRAQTRPVYRDGALAPRLILPLSLSYDHRVIDGAAAARFTRHICELLEDLRRIML